MRELKFDLTVGSNALQCPNPSDFYARAFIDSEATADNFRLLPNVKNKDKVANLLFQDILQAFNCSFVGTDSDLTAIDIEVESLSAMTEICQADIETSFIADRMSPGSNGAEWQVGDFMGYYWEQFGNKIGEEMAITRWQGDKVGVTGTFLDLVDGFEKIILASLNTIQIALPVAITKTNVIDKMIELYDALPNTIKHKTADVRFYVSSNVASAYLQAIAEANTILYFNASPELQFLGRIKIVIEEGLTDDTMVLTRKDNLIYAFDLATDAKSLKAVNLSESVAEPVLRTRVNLKTGYQIANDEEIVFYQA